MTFTKERQKLTLGALVALLLLLNGYRFLTADQPRTAPLLYPRGAVASSPVRQGLLSRGSGADPVNVFLERREQRFPGVSRDIFRMENPAASKPKTAVTPTALPPPPPPVPVKTPEEIAAEASRADLLRFRFLGYLTDKDSTLFLSKDGELFMVKSGEQLLKNYKVKEANKDSVVLLDTVTRVEVRIDLAGGEQAGQQQPSLRQQPQFQPWQPQQPQQRLQPQTPQPVQQLAPQPAERPIPPQMKRQMMRQEVEEMRKERLQLLQRPQQ